MGFLCLVDKTTFKKIGTFIHSTKFPSPNVALYLYKFTIQSCMECCCHVWAVAPSCYLEMLHTAGASLAVSHGSWAHHQNAASISLFCKYLFGRCWSVLAHLVPHGCSDHSNLEMKGECLTKTLSYLNLIIFRTKNGRNKLYKVLE